MFRLAIAVLCQLAVVAAVHATGAVITFDEPPTQPAAPTAADAIVARLIEPIACAHRQYGVRRIGTQVEISYIEPEVDCAVVPTPTPVAVPIGNLPVGTYTLLVIDETSSYPIGELDDQATLTVTAPTGGVRPRFDQPPVTPNAPSAGAAVSARVILLGSCVIPAVTVTRLNEVFDLTYSSSGDDCSGGLHEWPVEVPLGTLAAGFYRMRLRPLGGPLDDEASFLVTSPGCAPAAGADALCLQDGRFAITATWTSRDGKSGVGVPLPLGDESGAFWLTSPHSLEVLVRMSDACARNGRFWFLAGGTTNPNVGVSIRVRELATGFEQTYSSPPGKLFQSVRDVGSFLCPVP